MKPTIVHVITGLKTGGAELMLARLVEREERTAFRHVVISLTGDGAIAERIRAAGVPVYLLGLRPSLPNPLAVLRIARLLRRERAVVVQSWLYHADLLGGLGAWLARTPVAWGVHHGSLAPEVTSRSLAFVARACRAVARIVPTRIVCCAESARQAHAEYGYPVGKMLVIPNGFDLEQFRPIAATRQRVRDELGLHGEQPLVAIMSRFVPTKNHRLFVEAAGHVARDCPDARFLMAGEGLSDANPELAHWVRETGRADQFLLLGRRSDVSELLCAIDLLTVSSTTEAFPLIIGEAMATGVPCAVTDVGDNARMVGDTGRIVPSGDVEALAAAMTELISMPSAQRRALGMQARQRIASEFSIDTAAERYEALWRSLAAGERPCA